MVRTAWLLLQQRPRDLSRCRIVRPSTTVLEESMGAKDQHNVKADDDDHCAVVKGGEKQAKCHDKNVPREKTSGRVTKTAPFAPLPLNLPALQQLTEY